MAKQTVDIGTYANDGTGDSLRTAFDKINDNFTELYDGGGAGNLGDFKISGSALGTKALEGDGWGGYSMYFSPDGEGDAYIGIPNNAAAEDGGILTLSNYPTTGGGVRIQANTNYWTFKPDGTVTFPNNALNFGNNTADLKSSVYAELYYQGVSETWRANAALNSESYVWAYNEGVGIQLLRGANDDDPTWDHQWYFKNDGSLQLPTNGTIKDHDGNILVSSSTFIDLPNWLTAIAGTAHLPNLNTDYGWDSNGVWFTNATINENNEGISYPVRLADTIPANQGVVITVDFDADPDTNDFGIGVWETGTNPIWSWIGATGHNRIGAQYNGLRPSILAIAGDGVDDENGYYLPAHGTYRARLTISPPGDGAILITLETLNLSGTVLNTISYLEQPFSSSYSIGFAADQDNGTDKTYIKNLTVNINDSDIIHTDALTSYNSIGTTGTGAFSFADNTVTITSEDMRFRTTRVGFDIDCDFDIEADDDVFIDAMGNDVAISAANKVLITTSTLNMYGDEFYGQENMFLGTWDGTLLTLEVPNGETTLITLLNEYQNNARPIWLKTASGYTETENNDPASKNVGEWVTTFEIPLSATSPTSNADVLVIKLYDSINYGTYHEFEFTKDGKLKFPNGGMIEPVGMGWIGLTNGIAGTPVSILAKNNDGTERASINVYNSNTYGTASIYTTFAPGSPNTGNYNTASSTGSWDANPSTNLGTTGGSGNGLSVDVNVDVSGYADFVTVVNPGSGYLNGETVTVTSGSSSATFTITVQDYYHNWGFSELGATQLPGSIEGRVQGNTYIDATIELDVKATINKLTPISGLAQHYHLADGVQGQIMYIALASGGEMNAEDTCMSFDHARWSNGFGNISENTDVGSWMPFRNSSGGSTILTLAFIDGHWNLPHNFFD